MLILQKIKLFLNMKKILLLLFLLIGVSNYAKYPQATLYFKNGNTKTGSAKFPKINDKTIKFKSDKNEKIKSDELNKIVFTDKKGNNTEIERFYTLKPRLFKPSEFVKSKK